MAAKKKHAPATRPSSWGYHTALLALSLQVDGQATAATLAASTGLAPNTVRTLLRRMEAGGIVAISGDAESTTNAGPRRVAVWSLCRVDPDWLRDMRARYSHSLQRARLRRLLRDPTAAEPAK